MTLGELTESADVSVRTVRYYIAEGLLPPPESAGPGSVYTGGHLDRLRLIQRLKAAYLPLKEIRRRLSGLNDDDVRALLANEGDREVLIAKAMMNYDAPLEGAREYLAMLESRGRYRTEPMPLSIAPAGAMVPPQLVTHEHDAAPQLARSQGPHAAPLFPARPRAEPTERESDTASGRLESLWHRIPLGDEAELVISDRVYARHRDRIDWLVRWARKVFS
ncbi:MAG: MerR family transcriptional regulator [Chloroflexota bacterium]|nr:MerR family transcriptional regulator [Chloroflexota bacterium]